jgi:hypothetical protein
MVSPSKGLSQICLAARKNVHGKQKVAMGLASFVPKTTLRIFLCDFATRLMVIPLVAGYVSVRGLGDDIPLAQYEHESRWP